MPTSEASKHSRDRFEIVANILDVSQVGLRKTHIMAKANLRYEQMLGYLEELRVAGLLEQRTEEEAIVYGTTRKGRTFLDYFENMSRLLEMSGFSEEEPAQDLHPNSTISS